MTSKKLKKIGVALGQAMMMFKEVEANRVNMGFTSVVSHYTARKVGEEEGDEGEEVKEKDEVLPVIGNNSNGRVSRMKIVN